MKYLGIPVISLYQFIGRLRYEQVPPDAKFVVYAVMPNIEAEISEQHSYLSEYAGRINQLELMRCTISRRLFEGLLQNRLCRALECPVLSDLKRAGTTLLPYTTEAILDVIRTLQVQGRDLSDLYFVRIAPRTYAICDITEYRIAASEPELQEYKYKQYEITYKYQVATARLSYEPVSVVVVPRKA